MVTLDVTAIPLVRNNNVPKTAPLKTKTEKKPQEEKPLSGTVL
jgi:hypothetical protein